MMSYTLYVYLQNRYTNVICTKVCSSSRMVTFFGVYPGIVAHSVAEELFDSQLVTIRRFIYLKK